MPSWLTLVIAVAAVVAIFSTTSAGQRLAASLGIDALLRKGPPREDREFLLQVCGGNRRKLAERLDAERRKNRAMSEAQVYRRAIRTYMKGRVESETDGRGR